jgi:hypothetical protein
MGEPLAWLSLQLGPIGTASIGCIFTVRWHNADDKWPNFTVHTHARVRQFANFERQVSAKPVVQETLVWDFPVRRSRRTIRAKPARFDII